MKKRSLWILLTIIFAILIGIIVLVMPYYKEGENVRNRVLGLDRIKELEIKFQKNPTVDGCRYILDYFPFLKRYDDAIKIAEKCTALGSDKDKYGWLIRLRMAESYNGLGEKEKAIEQIKLAKKIDADNQIEKFEWLKTLKLDKLND